MPLYILLLFCSGLALANPVAAEATTSDQSWLGLPLNAWGICIAALIGEALVVALMVRKPLVRATVTWLVVTLVTFILFIVLPFFVFRSIIPAGANGYTPILISELVILLLEALAVYILWYRKEGVRFNKALSVSAVANLTSFMLGFFLTKAFS